MAAQLFFSRGEATGRRALETALVRAANKGEETTEEKRPLTLASLAAAAAGLVHAVCSKGSRAATPACGLEIVESRLLLPAHCGSERRKR